MRVEEYRQELLAEYADDGTGNWLNALARGGWQVLPHCRGLEFEIKYAPGGTVSKSNELGHYVRWVQNATLPSEIAVPHWLAFRTMTAEYWLVDGVEWSLQRFRGRKRLKRKVHRIFQAAGDGPPLIQSRETFLDDAERVDAVVGDFSSSLGTLRKKRAKGYLVRLDSGIVFNLTESRCYRGAAEQVQLEIEYSCHLHRGHGSPARSCTPDELRAHLWDLDRCVAPVLRQAGLVPTTERKQDFVRGSREA